MYTDTSVKDHHYSYTMPCYMYTSLSCTALPALCCTAMHCTGTCSPARTSNRDCDVLYNATLILTVQQLYFLMHCRNITTVTAPCRALPCCAVLCYVVQFCTVLLGYNFVYIPYVAPCAACHVLRTPLLGDIALHGIASHS